MTLGRSVIHHCCDFAWTKLHLQFFSTLWDVVEFYLLIEGLSVKWSESMKRSVSRHWATIAQGLIHSFGDHNYLKNVTSLFKIRRCTHSRWAFKWHFSHSRIILAFWKILIFEWFQMPKIFEHSKLNISEKRHFLNIRIRVHSKWRFFNYSNSDIEIRIKIIRTTGSWTTLRRHQRCVQSLAIAIYDTRCEFHPVLPKLGG